MRDVVCAQAASCGPGLHLMCPTTARVSIIHHCQVDPEPHICTGPRAARVHGCAKYVGAVDSVIRNELHRARSIISCPSVVIVR